MYDSALKFTKSVFATSILARNWLCTLQRNIKLWMVSWLFRTTDSVFFYLNKKHIELTLRMDGNPFRLVAFMRRIFCHRRA